MADSENSRTLSAVTRRKLLAGTAMATMTQFVHIKSSSAASLMQEEENTADPLLALWRDWRAAHLETVRLCQRQQQLETRLMAEVRVPRVEITLPGQRKRVPVFAIKDIDRWLGDRPENADKCARAKAEFTTLQALWDDADRRIGYTRAREAELLAVKREEQLVEALWAAPAQSISGVAAKLDAVLCNGEPCDDCCEFPWPQLRSLRNDIILLGALGIFAA